MGTPNRALPTVVVGVGAGIAAYKVAYAVRGFRKLGWNVHVVPTPSSLNFVGRATWSELSENPAPSDVFDAEPLGHVELARRADVIVLAPATADLLARARAGMADDLLTATILASSAPVIAFPAMHTAMWQSLATQDNVRALKERGWSIVEPATGALSSGDVGLGRMVEPDVIVDATRGLLERHENPGCLSGKHVVITAGGTQEPIDPVRYVGNRSTGKFGVELARQAAEDGAQVTLIVAGTSVPLPSDQPQIKLVNAPSAEQMRQAVAGVLPSADALIMAAAVADFTPQSPSESKIKKTGPKTGLTLQLVQTVDILKEVTNSSPDAIVIGLGAETGSEDEVLQKGREKALYKGADLLAVNRVGTGAGFGDVKSKLWFFTPDGELVDSSTGDKKQLASQLLARLCSLIEESS